MDQLAIEKTLNQSLVHEGFEYEVRKTLESLLLPFKDRKKGLKSLARKMGVHEKTLLRILSQSHKPSYQTVFKIYRIHLNEFNDVKVLDLVPINVREFLVNSNSQVLSHENNYSSLVDQELQSNPIAAELYVLAATGPLLEDWVQQRFGSYGRDLLARLLRVGALKELHPRVYGLGKNQAVFDGETIVAVGKAMIDSHAKPQKGETKDQNFIAFFAEGLSSEAFEKWLQIDEQAYRQKIELTRDPRNLGGQRAFTFMIAEKMQLDESL